MVPSLKRRITILIVIACCGIANSLASDSIIELAMSNVAAICSPEAL